jgi:hypothetical protein
MAIKKLCPFKLWTLQNFPFIAEDFDALTNYELMCKIVEYLNNVIDITNEQTNAINELKTWFDNLDVQDEINNKLDEMAESGELEEIIAEYLNAKVIFAFDNVEDMKQSSILVNGTYAKTLGYTTKNDGGGATYKIRNIATSDVIDEGLIIVINEDLIAELIIDNYVTPEMFGAIGDNSTDDTNAFIKAINSNIKIIGSPNKIYKLNTTIETSNNIDINNCNFTSDSHESETDIKFIFITSSNNVKFNNCSFESTIDQIPVINQINGSTDGLASNVSVLRASNGCVIENCTFTRIYGPNIRGGKASITNCIFNEVEMGMYINTDENTIVENCRFIMNRLVNSQYYHALYVSKSKEFIGNNLFIKEINEGQCGDHLHFRSAESTDLRTESGVLNNIIFEGNLSYDYIMQNKNAKITIDNLIYNGDTGGSFQNQSNGYITLNNSKIKCNNNILFDCSQDVKVNNCEFNCPNNIQLVTNCSFEMQNSKLNCAGSLDLTLTSSNIFRLLNNIIYANSISALSSNGSANYINNCIYHLTTGNINIAGRGIVNAIIKHAENPSSLGTIDSHNSYLVYVYQSNTYYKKFESFG